MEPLCHVESVRTFDNSYLILFLCSSLVTFTRIFDFIIKYLILLLCLLGKWVATDFNKIWNCVTLQNSTTERIVNRNQMQKTWDCQRKGYMQLFFVFVIFVRESGCPGLCLLLVHTVWKIRALWKKEENILISLLILLLILFTNQIFNSKTSFI